MTCHVPAPLVRRTPRCPSVARVRYLPYDYRCGLLVLVAAADDGDHDDDEIDAAVAAMATARGRRSGRLLSA